MIGFKGNKFTILCHEWDNDSDLRDFINSEIDEERAVKSNVNCRQIGDHTIWFKKVPIELFKHRDSFNWVSGSSNLWVDEQPLTIHNYMDVEIDKITDERPNIDDEINI